MSWLLPFALISMVVVLFAAKIKLPLESNAHKGLLIWGGWLLTCVVFFSMISGIFHAYYAIMLAPPLGVVVAMGFTQLWDWGKEKSWAGMVLFIAAVLTFGFQIFATVQYGEKTAWLYVAGALLIAGGVLMFFQRKLAYLTVLSSLIVIPAYWTVMTTVSNANQNLPTAYTGSNPQAGPGGFAPDQSDGDARGSNVNSELLTFLQANTQDVEYLVAVPSSHQGSTLVLATGRPVLFMGGFGGQDDVVSAEDLAQMVADGDPEHRHPQEQTGYLVSGRLEFSVEGTKLVAEPGSSWGLPADLPHGASALEDSIVVEVFSPVREDHLPS